jgi:uncharacterized Zn-finger protein
MATHTKEKRFLCVCGRLFTRNDNMTRHQRGKNGVKPCATFQEQLSRSQ